MRERYNTSLDLESPNPKPAETRFRSAENAGLRPRMHGRYAKAVTPHRHVGCLLRTCTYTNSVLAQTEMKKSKPVKQTTGSKRYASSCRHKHRTTTKKFSSLEYVRTYTNGVAHPKQTLRTQIPQDTQRRNPYILSKSSLHPRLQLITSILNASRTSFSIQEQLIHLSYVLNFDLSSASELSEDRSGCQELQSISVRATYFSMSSFRIQ